MKHIKHIGMMIFGYCLFLLTFKIIDMNPKRRFFKLALPFIGYQGYHPIELKWWQPVPKNYR